jgi:DNA-binding NtrC family response regulator
MTIDTVNKKMKGALAQMMKAAPTDMAVTIFGAKGVGKSRCARIIHENSEREAKPFVTVSCGDRDIDSSFKSAEDGTLFFCDFNTYPEAQQSEISEYLRASASRCRLITSSAESLEKFRRRYSFSEDLYHKLSVIQIKIPSLEERKDDFPLLVKDLSAEISGWLHKKEAVFSGEVLKKLSARNWPNNIAELKNVLFFLLNNAKTLEILECDIPIISISSSKREASLNNELYRVSADLIAFAKERGIFDVAAEYEKLLLFPLFKAALDATKNNKTKSAELLGMNRNTFRTKLKSLSSQSD